MNSLILCEGMTDAILLSYYLIKTAGWSYCKQPKDIAIIEDKIKGESVNWYKKNEDRLLICGVGGKDKMKSFFADKILRTMTDAAAFSKIAVVLDRDDKEITDVEAHASSIFQPVIKSMINNQWISNTYKGPYLDENVEALLVVIPTEHEGALETLLMDSISEDPYDAVIVQKAGEFVADIEPDAGKYLVARRDKLKAHLGVTWAIQYPEKVFRFINDQINSVEWEKSEVLSECFKELIKI
ncbi:MAG: hypothetical protein K5665_02430 [Saccharofermentans sp.]|nr:hypothetical protein [Saccharofermentans sp.]